MMPNWIGLMPMDIATGSRIGVAIRIIGAMSMIIPRTSRIRFSSSATTIGLEEIDVISCAALAGTCNSVRQLPKAAEKAIRISTMDSVSTQLSSDFHTPFQFSPL